MIGYTNLQERYKVVYDVFENGDNIEYISDYDDCMLFLADCIKHGYLCWLFVEAGDSWELI